MFDPDGQKIRELKSAPALASFNEGLSDQMAQYTTRCKFRNLRGECANPNILDEDGMMMSWEKYDAYKARGVDPQLVHQKSKSKNKPNYPGFQGNPAAARAPWR